MSLFWGWVDYGGRFPLQYMYMFIALWYSHVFIVAYLHNLTVLYNLQIRHEKFSFPSPAVSSFNVPLNHPMFSSIAIRTLGWCHRLHSPRSSGHVCFWDCGSQVQVEQVSLNLFHGFMGGRKLRGVWAESPVICRSPVPVWEHTDYRELWGQLVALSSLEFRLYQHMFSPLSLKAWLNSFLLVFSV